MLEQAIRLIVILLVFVATVLLVEGGYRWLRTTRDTRRALNQRMRMIERGADREHVAQSLRRARRKPLFPNSPLEPLFRGFDRMIAEAGMRQSSAAVLGWMAAAVGGIAVLLLVAAVARAMPLSAGGLLMLALAATALGAGVPLLVIARRRNRRKKLLREQFPVALDVFVRGLRAGHSVPSAIELLTADLADPIGSEFGMVQDEMTYGLDLRTALQNMADRCGIEDMHMFVVSLSVQHETGGNLAEILEGLAKVIRDRASMLLAVRALSSEGRMSGMMLTAMPALTFGGLFLVNPAFYLDVAKDSMFLPGFAILLSMYAVGVLMIRRMIDLKV